MLLLQKYFVKSFQFKKQLINVMVPLLGTMGFIRKTDGVSAITGFPFCKDRGGVV